MGRHSSALSRSNFKCSFNWSTFGSVIAFSVPIPLANCKLQLYCQIVLMTHTREPPEVCQRIWSAFIHFIFHSYLQNHLHVHPFSVFLSLLNIVSTCSRKDIYIYTYVYFIMLSSGWAYTMIWIPPVLSVQREPMSWEHPEGYVWCLNVAPSRSCNQRRGGAERCHCCRGSMELDPVIYIILYSVVCWSHMSIMIYIIICIDNHVFFLVVTCWSICSLCHRFVVIAGFASVGGVGDSFFFFFIHFFFNSSSCQGLAGLKASDTLHMNNSFTCNHHPPAKQKQGDT